jgi:hypothetical protein
VATPAEIENRSKRLNERLAGYIPPRETWTPADEALFKPIDLLRVPVDEAQEMQLKAIKYAFKRHYTYNQFYHEYCKMGGVSPDDLKTSDDFNKIPLIPDSIFKQHPSGKDLAYWITSIFTGDLPKVVIKGANPTFDDVINAFNEQAGMAVTYSSGTSGQHTVIPRDQKTMHAFQYGWMKMWLDIWDPTSIDHALNLIPKPTRSNLFAAKLQEVFEQLFEDHHYALDFEISADLALRAAVDHSNTAVAEQLSADGQLRKIFTIGTQWLERYEKTTDTIWILSFPALFSVFLDALEAQGKHFDFGERGVILTGGGWKTKDGKNMPHGDFRKRVEEVLGIPETRCLDSYGMSELNGAIVACPEGHYYHLPPWMKLFILDEGFKPVGYGEFGRLTFLDPLAYSYPGFVISGDEVRMFEHCPVCDRPGPVLDTVIQRVLSVEGRGCATLLQKVLEQELEAQ